MSGKTRTALILGALSLSLLLAGCTFRKTVFDGSRISDESKFLLEYECLDGVETAEFRLEKGEALKVLLSHDGGSVDITVGMDGEDPLYTGTDQTDAEFLLTAAKDGLYRVSVTGHRAEGSTFFFRVRPGEG